MLSTNCDGCSILLCSLWELTLTEESTYVEKKKQFSHKSNLWTTNSYSVMECKWTYSI